MVLMNFQAKQQLLGATRTDTSLNLAQGTQVDVVVRALREKLESEAGVMQAFHAMDTDNSGQLSVDEFADVLRQINFKVPRATLEAVIARFDANNDGHVSIPEFAAFMLGRMDLRDELANAEKVPAAPTLGDARKRSEERQTEAARDGCGISDRKERRARLTAIQVTAATA